VIARKPKSALVALTNVIGTTPAIDISLYSGINLWFPDGYAASSVEVFAETPLGNLSLGTFTITDNLVSLVGDQYFPVQSIKVVPNVSPSGTASAYTMKG